MLTSHPLDTLRTRQAVTGRSVRHTARELMANGARNLYAGVLSPCVSVGMWKATTLGLNHNLMGWLAARRGGPISELPLWQVWGAACVAGSAATGMFGPFELLKSRTMLEPDFGVGGVGRVGRDRGSASILKREVDMAVRIFRSEGAAGAARGLPLLMVRDAWATGFFMGSYEATRRVAIADAGLSPWVAGLAAGLVAGPVGWVVCYPVEVLRIRWMCTDDPRGKWGSYSNAARAIYAEAGAKAFFRGLPACCARSALQIPVTMAVFEVLLGRDDGV